MTEQTDAAEVLSRVRALVSSWEHGNDTFGATERERNRTAVLREIVGEEPARAAAAAARGAEGGGGE